jgi:hypothetical protein
MINPAAPRDRLIDRVPPFQSDVSRAESMPQTSVGSPAISARTVRSLSCCGWHDGCRIHARRFLAWLLAALVCTPITAQASFFKGEALDTAANVLAWVVMILVPVAGIALFWMVHVLPEKIAEKRHHPQQTAIKTLCLLSLVFGGMLWPIAWLWAYTKPVSHRLAYGTDKHESYFEEACEQAEKGELPQAELEAIRQELDELAARGHLTRELRAVRDRLAMLQISAQPGQPGGAL